MTVIDYVKDRISKFNPDKHSEDLLIGQLVHKYIRTKHWGEVEQLLQEFIKKQKK